MTNPVANYQIRVINDALTSENRIHSDDIAKKFGFTGALVSGVSVYGHLTHPLVATYGEEWLGQSAQEVRLIKPAYVNDLLTIKTEWVSDSDKQCHHLTKAYNDANALVAQLESWRSISVSETVIPAYENPDSEPLVREEICWEKIKLGKAAPTYSFTLSNEQHKDCLAIMRDKLALYHQNQKQIQNLPTPCLHPYYLLKECNQALMRMFFLPAWIHVGSRLVLRQPMRVGQTVDVHTVPIDKWERKGHQFIKLRIVMTVANKPALEAEHTAIFRIAG